VGSIAIRREKRTAFNFIRNLLVVRVLARINYADRWEKLLLVMGSVLISTQKPFTAKARRTRRGREEKLSRNGHYLGDTRSS
jgi:hypothetical protein